MWGMSRTAAIQRFATRIRARGTVPRYFAVCIVLAPSLAARVGHAQSPGGIADYVPGNACFAAFSSNVGASCHLFEKSSFGAKLCGPDFSLLAGELGRLNLAGPLNPRPAIGMNWSDLLQVRDPGGFVIFPLENRSVGIAWLFTSTTALDQTPPCLLAAERYFRGQGYQKSTHQVGDVAVAVFALPTTQISQSQRVLFVGRRYYGVANSPAAAEALLNVRSGQSLTDQESFRKTFLADADGNPTSKQHVNFFIRPIELRELVVPKRNQDADSGPARARRLGFDAVQSIAGHLEFEAPKPCEWEMRAEFRAPRPYRSAMRLLELQPGAFPIVPDWVRDDVASVWFWRWDFPTAMKGFGNLFDEMNQPGPDGEGMFEDMLNGIHEDPEGVKVDLRREVFAQLTPDVVRVRPIENREHPSADQATGERWLFVAGIREPETVANALKRFYAGDKRVSHGSSGNYELWTVPEGSSLFVEGESTSVVTVRALAIGEGKLLFGPDVDFLKSKISSNVSGSRLADSAAWSPLLKWIERQEDSQTALRGLMRLDQVLADSYRSAATDDETADENDFLTNLWRLLLYGTMERSQALPYSTVPQFERLRDALPEAGMFLSLTDDGWKVELGVAQEHYPVAIAYLTESRWENAAIHRSKTDLRSLRCFRDGAANSWIATTASLRSGRYPVGTRCSGYNPPTATNNGSASGLGQSDAST